MRYPQRQFTKREAQQLFVFTDGKLYWKIRSQGRRIGSPIKELFYHDGTSYSRRVVIYNYHFGILPKKHMVIHLNHNKNNCQLENLALANAKQYAMHKVEAQPDRESIFSHPSGLIFCKIGKNWLGYHRDFSKAVAAKKIYLREFFSVHPLIPLSQCVEESLKNRRFKLEWDENNKPAWTLVKE